MTGRTIAETTPTRETVIQVGRAVVATVFVFVLPVVFRETGVIEVKLIYRVMQVCQALQRTGEKKSPLIHVCNRTLFD